MLHVIRYFCFIHFALSSTDTDRDPSVYRCSRDELYKEISGLRQLVNQESLYRQELELQMREVRQQMLNVNTPMTAGIKTETWNLSCSANSSQKLDERMTIFEKNLIQKMDQNQGLILGILSNISLNIHELKQDYLQNRKVNKTNAKTGNATTKYGKGHMGKSFAIMVPPGLNNRHMPISLIISCEFSTQITLVSSYPGLTRVFNVTPPGTNLTLPNDFALSINGDLVQSKGIILESTEYVSVYVFNEDGYVALPARYLGTHYKSMTTDHGDSFIAIMPYGGSASVSLTSTRGVADQNLHIPELSVYFLSSSSRFENVMISSNRTIAVISGHVKSFASRKQIVYDSILPINYWNTSFIVPYIQNTTFKYDFYYSTVSRRINLIRNNISSETTTSPPYTFFSSGNTVSNFVQAKQGSLSVVLWYYRGTVLSSFMSVVPALSQFSNNYHFWTPFNTDNNFLAAIIKENDSDGFKVDNLPITNPYMSHSVSTLDGITYRVLTISVTHGWHIVKHIDPDVNFGLIMYGGDLNVAYGLPLGLRFD